ncbi:MAG TPA: hypothetical protein VFA53_11910 [Xanthobacteraceae bacterium]|nr:hypothetical protein [Xanthobacteraceae bacterium]
MASQRRTDLVGLILGTMIVLAAITAFVVYGGQCTGASKVVSFDLSNPSTPK